MRPRRIRGSVTQIFCVFLSAEGLDYAPHYSLWRSVWLWK